MVPVKSIHLYTNIFGEPYFVSTAEREEYSLEEMRLEYARKGLKVAETDIMAIIIDIFDAIRYFHSEGFMLTSFSLVDIVLFKGRWRFKSMPFL